MRDYRKLFDREKTLGCPVCESDNVNFEMETQEFLYDVDKDAVQLAAEVHVGKCSDCGFEFTGESAEIARHEAVCRHLKVTSPCEIWQLRKSYGLSRAEFAALTRLGTASLARWETGQLIQNAAYDSLLFLLKFPDNLERLRHRFSRDAKKQMARANEIRCANDPADPRFRTFETASPDMVKRAAQFELNPTSIQ